MYSHTTTKIINQQLRHKSKILLLTAAVGVFFTHPALSSSGHDIAADLSRKAELTSPASNPPTPASATQSGEKQSEPARSAYDRASEIRGTEEAPLIIKTVPSEDAQSKAAEDAEERKHKATSDWWIIVLTGLLAIATIALVVVTGGLVWFAWRQARDMQRSVLAAETAAQVARDTLIASNRPWVRVDLKLISDIEYNETGAMVTVLLIFKNIGKSPAYNVYGRPSICATTNDRKASNIIDEADLRDPEIRRTGGLGYNLLPDEEAEEAYTLVLTQKEIADGGFGRSSIPGLERDGSQTHMALDIYGVIRYSDQITEKWHHTSFIRCVRRLDGTGTFHKYGPAIRLAEICLVPHILNAKVLD